MTLTRSGDEIAAYFGLELAAEEAAGGELQARFNIAPSQEVLTIVRSTDSADQSPAPPARAALWKTWGLIPSWSKDPKRGGSLFNARSETVDVKPSFRAAWKQRRCLVVADGFYEWSPRHEGHQPYHFTARSGKILAMAGLFEEWVDGGDAFRGAEASCPGEASCRGEASRPSEASCRGEASGRSSSAAGSGEVIESCTVLTTEANADLEAVHHRMPVLLHPDQFDAWLDPGANPAALKPFFRPAKPDTLKRVAVADYVNSSRNDDPACLNPPEPPRTPEPPAQPDLFALESPTGDESS